MNDVIEINANVRKDVGKGASRRLRREQHLVPGIIYGAKKDPENICIEERVLRKAAEKEAFYSQIMNLVVDNKKQKVVLKDLQRHPYKASILHFDFLRISDTEKLAMRIPLKVIGADVAPGIKLSGGIVSNHMVDVEISCLPSDLPENIEVDISQLEADKSVHLSDLSLPKGVELVALMHDSSQHNLPVVSIHVPRGGATADDDDAQDADAEAKADDKKEDSDAK